jgi:tRNA threonylcarbamoyladenosine biosynthesis protein TsaB
MTSTMLAIDTATQFASVALYQEGTGIIAESSWHTAMNHTVELMPTIVRTLRLQNLAPERLNAVAVALGPGSFTGLRIGLSVAKGLCMALELPIVGIPTLDIVAYAHFEQKLPIFAILQAGRGRICAAFYVREEGGWLRATDYQLVSLEELSNRAVDPTLFCGEIDMALRESLTDKAGDRAVIATQASSLRRAGYLAELGLRKLQDTGGDELASLEPLYLHYPQDR